MNAENALNEPFSLPFNEYIRMFPSSWLFEHFLKHSGPAARKVLSSNALADRISSFSEPASLIRQFESLDPQAQIVCSCAYLFGQSGCRSESGESRTDDPLVLSFLLCLARNKAGMLKYFGFGEFEKPLRPGLVKTLLEKGKSTAAITSAVHGPDCMNDIATLISLGAQGVLERKKQGELTKNALRRICGVIHEMPHRHDTEAYADFLLHFAVAQGVLRANDTSYRLVKSAAEDWFSMHDASQAEDLREFAVQHAGAWNINLLTDLLHGAGPHWLSVGLFPASVAEDALNSLKVLSWIRMIDLVKSGSEFYFKAASGGISRPKHAETGGKVTVLPDFTAVLLAHTDPETLYRFGQVGSLHSLDRVYKGTIDRPVLNDSLTRGLGGEDALSWLAEWNAPPNVMVTVREWIREYNRIYISSGPVLIAADEKVADEIASYGPLQNNLRRVPAYAVFRLNPGAADEVRRLLAGMGYDFRMPQGEEEHAPDAAGEAKPASPAWEPVTGSTAEKNRDEKVLRGKKYGSGLKTFDLNETMNIIDYSILTSQEIEIDYAGSPLVKKGIYVVRPVSVAAGAEPLLTATDANARSRQFHVRRIQRIGVGT